MWLYSDGYAAFFASVNGWLLGLLFFPFIVKRLRLKRALSLPEWLEKTYGDIRVRKLVALTMVFLYILYLVTQFRAFGIIVSYMLDIPSGFTSTSLIYLFVLYTTFGGYISVVRSDILNLFLIILGVTAAAAY
jgi:SSS family solute:Na+ symporter